MPVNWNNLFSHATESPFGTIIGTNNITGEASDTIINALKGLYKAKQIADFVLSASFSDDERGTAQDIVRNHGLLDGRERPEEAMNPEEIMNYGCVLAIAHFYAKIEESTGQSFIEREVAEAYEKCVRAVNSLAYFHQAPEDRSSRPPVPGKLDRGEHWKLDRAWDICVCLLGAIKTFCAFKHNFYVGDAPFVHVVHYKRAVKMALDDVERLGKGRICPKALNLLTREETAPFVQPKCLISKLRYNVKSQGFFDHTGCKVGTCKFDSMQAAQASFHTRKCPNKSTCTKSMPPRDSFTAFDTITCSGMPSVSLGYDGAPNTWWSAADPNTLVISHVWGDGLQGTRNEGLNQCVHQLFVDIAQHENVGCESYWIDCATIPEEMETRQRMIKRINHTFHQARIVLCWDEGVASLGSATTEETLLSLIVSPWHRRAWTLLEGNRSTPSAIRFLIWKNDISANPPFKLFNLQDAVLRALRDRNFPLWIRSALVELLPYSGVPLPTDAAGLLLSGRHASRQRDAETIWSLLRPSIPLGMASVEDLQPPYANSRGIKTVDVAFISSNAARQPESCWEPKTANPSVWVRTAYGGIPANITQGNHLVAHWWAKKGAKWAGHVNWVNGVEGADRKLLESLGSKTFADNDFALICPILKGDPIYDKGTYYSKPPVEGFFRASISMECRRAIVITRGVSNIWKWQTIVNLKEGKHLFFTTQDYDRFEIGRD